MVTASRLLLLMDFSGECLPLEYGSLNYENSGAFGGWTISMIELARRLTNLNDPSAAEAILNPDSIEQMLALPDNWVGAYNPGFCLLVYLRQGWAPRLDDRRC